MERFYNKEKQMQEILLTMQCLDDPSSLEFFGEPSDIAASFVLIEIDRCVEDNCQTEDAIDEFLSKMRFEIVYNK